MATIALASNCHIIILITLLGLGIINERNNKRHYFLRRPCPSRPWRGDE